MKSKFLLLALAAVLGAQTVGAITLLVYNNNNNAAGSLRQAIQDNGALGGGNTIIFSDVVTGTITLTNGELFITNDVTIIGPGANVLAVNGNGASRLFDISSGATISISGLTLTNGDVRIPGCGLCIEVGGGILSSDSILTLSNCVISGNSATSGGGIFNEAHHNNAKLIIVHSTLYGNSANNGGGIENVGNNGSAGSNTATVVVINSTLYGNSASIGGAILNRGPAVLTLSGCTLSANTGESDFVIANFGTGGLATLELGDTILNEASIYNEVGFGTPVISRGYNLCNDDGGGFLTALADQVNTDPMLGPLQDNGGPTPTMMPLPGSPAIDQGKRDAIPALATTTDQRGRPRTFDNPAIYNATLGDGSDIGAYELNPPTSLVVTNINDSGPGSLREVIGLAAPGDSISFAPSVTSTITLTNGELLIDKSLTIVGPTAASVSLSGNGSRVLHVTSGTVSLANLTIRNGFAEGYFGGLVAPGGDGNGGGILNEAAAALTLTACTLTGNTATGGDGGISFYQGVPAGAGGHGKGGAVFNRGTLHLINCTLSGNSAAGGTGGWVVDFSAKGGNGGNGDGGGLFNQSTLTLTHCTFSSNSVTGGSGGAGNPYGNNGSGNGGGLYHSQGSTTVSNCIIAGNSAVSTGPDIAGTFYSGGYNLIGRTDGSSGFVNGVNQDQAGTSASPTNAMLGPLQDNGGPTFTHALLTGSPAIDKGNSFGLTTDQRGRLRSYDYSSVANATGGDGSDIGAFELQQDSPLLSITRSANNVVLSWSTNDTGYTLEAKTNLSPAVIWTTVPGTPMTFGSQYVVTNGPVTGNKFYRLKP